MSYNLSRLGRLIRKELSEILRDRRTIVTLVLMPILLYPLLSVAFQQFFLASRLTPGQGIEYSLGFEAEEDAARFYDRLRVGEWILEQRLAASGKEKKAKTPAEPKFIQGVYDDLEKELRAGRIDAIVRRVRAPVKESAPLPQGGEPFVPFEILFLPTSPGAQGVLTYIDQRLAAANELDLFRLLEATKRGPRTSVVGLTHTPLDEAAAGPIISLASLVPLILILMTITGAVYPAIDLTAGERERGTLEILVAAPVPRLGLLFAKYVSVVTVAILTGLVNLVAMTMTLVFS